MYVFSGSNPTVLYYDALKELLEKGINVSPRGKEVLELRPAIFEYLNPKNRVTFLGGRKINPFFQLAESLWIISGCSDTEWLCKFNANMSQFSDDGKYFNAPYGERIRYWNKNDAHNIIINPIDQLNDAYNKLFMDKDTRQAVVVISNPMFDNFEYTIKEKGKDIACNLVFTLKIRQGKLDITVFNRSNDLHWGVMGANLCQFSTIQEVVASWLGIEVGNYYQITDSLHIYLDTYGSKCTEDILEYYKKPVDSIIDYKSDFECVYEPRMSLSKPDFDEFLNIYWKAINPYIMDDEFLKSDEISDLMAMLKELYEKKLVDDYWYFTIQSMIAYRLFKLEKLENTLEVLKDMAPCQWKISMMYFLKNRVQRFLSLEENSEKAKQTVEHLYYSMVLQLGNSLKNPDSKSKLEGYLSLLKEGEHE